MTSATNRECRLIRPAADRECVFLRCRNHAVTMAHRAGGCHSPWAVFLPYRFNGSQCFFKKFDRQVTFLPAFLSGRGWQTPQLFRTRKDTERSCAFCVPSSFSCLSKFSVIQFSQVIRPKETLRGTNGYSSPFVHIQHTEKTRPTT